MINLVAHLDREKDRDGSVIILHAHATIPDICADLELIVAHIVKGLAQQLPEAPDRRYKAAVMFAIAAAVGATRGLREYREDHL